MMANAPDRFLTWRWVEEPDDENTPQYYDPQKIQAGVPYGPKKLQYSTDSKRPNAGTFILAKEDHTLGNLFRMNLLKNPNVRYAGYRMPHPLIFDCHIKIETKDATVDPVMIFNDSMKELINEIDGLKNEFENACQEYERNRGEFENPRFN